MEEWRAVQGYEGLYEVSNLGRVRRVKPDWNGRKRIAEPLVLKPQSGHRMGYLQVNLHLGSADGHRRQKSHRIHVLVARAFIGTCPTGLIINHKNFNTADNRVDNLEYVTPLYNTLHTMMAGRLKPWTVDNPPVGERNPNAKLAWKAVRQIRRLWKKDNITKRALAERFGVSSSMIGYIIKGENWKEEESGAV